ncbi:hypothetical protein V2J09_012048 [Rumex salicifolius]
MMKSCWSSSIDREDGLLWHKDSEKFSMAVMQANQVVEDQSQIESDPFMTFVGVYDGHGGSQAAQFVNKHLLLNLKRLVSENQGVSEGVIKKAFLDTDKSFVSRVKKQWMEKPYMASIGTCCLVGIICNGSLYVANAGDSRAILGRFDRDSGKIRPIQLSSDHNAEVESEREELQSLHPYDSQIVTLNKHNVWRVKGIIQVTRSIGDAYLKDPEFNKSPLPAKFRVAQPFNKPILRAEPTISVRRLQPQDQFVVFASDGLWEHLSNREVVDIVSNHPRQGIARRLVKTALKRAAKKREIRYSDLKNIEAGVRRHFHDDITVIVVFLEDNSMAPISIKGGACIAE